MAESKIETPANLSLKSRLGFLLKDSAIYGGAAAISRAFALITFPLLARHFSVTEYGVLDFFLVLVSLLSTFFVFGQDSAVARYFYEHEDTAERRQLISQSLVFQLTGLGLLLPLIWLNADWLTVLLVDTPDSVQLFKIVLLQLPFALLIVFSQGLLRWTFYRTRFLIMSLGFTVVQSILLVIAVIIFDVGIQGVLFVNLLTSAVFGSVGLFFVQQWITLPKSFLRLREMLPFAIPYGLICCASAFSPILERTMTIDLLGSEDLGIYAVGMKISMLLGLIVSAFHSAWGPFSLSLFKQVDSSRTYNWIFKMFAIGMCMSVLILTTVAPPLIHFLATDRYSSAAIVVFPLAMGLAIQATGWISEIGIVISKRSHLNLYSYTAALAATSAGIWLLTPLFGLLGVGLGVLLGQIIKALISSWLAQRAYPLIWHYRPVVLVFAVALMGGLVATWLQVEHGTVSARIVIALTMLSVLGVGWLSALSKSERQRIFSFLRKDNSDRF